MRSLSLIIALGLFLPLGISQGYKIANDSRHALTPRQVQTTAITLSNANMLLRETSAKQTSAALNGTQVWDQHKGYVGNISGIISDAGHNTVLVVVKNSIDALPLIMPLPLFLASYETGLPETAFYDALAEAKLNAEPAQLSMIVN